MHHQKGNDRRHGVRVEFGTEVEVTVASDDLERKYRGSSKDLSLRGIYIKTDNKLELETRCSVEIKLVGVQEELILKMEGHVVREDEAGFAIYFESVDLDSYSHLKNIVKYNTPENDNDDS